VFSCQVLKEGFWIDLDTLVAANGGGRERGGIQASIGPCWLLDFWIFGVKKRRSSTFNKKKLQIIQVHYSRPDTMPKRQKDTEGPVTTDPRFSIIHTDPRFARSKKKDVKVPIDSRFKAAFKDKEFIDQRILPWCLAMLIQFSECRQIRQEATER